MNLNIVCDYCHGAGCPDLFMITLTSLSNRKNSCSKIICNKCASKIGMTLDAILDKRDIDDALKEIENDILDGN